MMMKDYLWWCVFLPKGRPDGALNSFSEYRFFYATDAQMFFLARFFYATDAQMFF